MKTKSIDEMNIPSGNIQFKILIVEDDKNLAFLVQKKLSRLGYIVDLVYSGEELFEAVKKETPSLLLMDFRLGDMSGKEIVQTLKDNNFDIPFIIMTGFGDEKTAVEMMKLGAVDYLVKDQNFLEILIPVVEKVKDQIELGIQLNETKEHLRKSEIRFQTLIENSTDITMIFDDAGNIGYQSSSVNSVLGYSSAELQGKSFFSFFHPEDIDSVKSKFETVVLQQNKVENFIFRVKHKDQTYRHLEGTFNNLLTNPNILGVLANLRDITKRISAEEEIRRLSLAVTQSPVSIVMTDKDGRIEYVNPRFEESSGYSFDEVKNKNHNLLKSGRHSNLFYKDLWDTISSGNEWRGEIQNKNKQGELYWESVSISPVLDASNKIMHFIGIKEDITEKKISEEKIKKAHEFYLTLFEDSPTMIWRCSKDGSRNYFNKTWLKFRGHSPEQELGDNWQAGIHSEDKERYLFEYNAAFQNKEPLKTMFRLKRVDDEYRWINEFIKPFYDIDGYFAGIIGTCIDITESKNAENAMRKAKEEAEKSEALKTEFLAQMSHEIRTPINAILSFTSLLKYELEDTVDDDLRESFRIIDKGGRRLIRTIDLLLHMSEIQTGNYEIAKKDLNLKADIIDNVLLELANFAALKQIEIQIDHKDVDCQISADEHSVMQIFENLVDNAIKYNRDEEGSININIYNGQEDKVCVDITDSGIGISEDFIAQIFQPFTQEESGYTRKFEGNGLGLALVKKYCEINNAEIQVKSEKGKGSTFTVILPRRG